MKKTLVSLAAASLIVTSAVAADKGIDIVTTGQAVVYYQTGSNNGDIDTTLFGQDDSIANVGIQLNLDADLKNNFTFGSQLTYLGTAGLEKNLVSGTTQNVVAATNMNDISDEIALTKIFIAKKIGNTTVKLGRQELPKSLSPLAFSESWNVFKNTFEAALVVNTDIPDTTLVGAYVGQSNASNGNISSFTNLTAGPGYDIKGTAYMLTAQNKSVPMTTITATYYALGNIATADVVPAVTANNEGANAIWGDVQVAGKDLPMGLKIGLQGGQISPEASELDATTAVGAKIGLKPVDALSLCLAYTSVNDGSVAVVNTGTGVKTPLYTQMVANQNSISLDANTFMLKADYNLGDFGSLTAQGTMTSAGDNNRQNVGTKQNDLTDLELIYKVKAAGVTYLAAYVNQTWSEKDANNKDNNNIVRVWARYAF